MKKHYLLSGMLTFVLCCLLTSVNAQCKKSKSSCSKSKTEQAEQSKTTSCSEYRSYSSCTYKKTSCNKSRYNDFFYNDNYVTAFGGGTVDSDNQFNATAGLEYERKLSYGLGIGALAEVNFTAEPTIIMGVPFSVHFNKSIRLSASPIVALQQSTVTTKTADEKEWASSFGARLGLSYMMNINGLIIAPTIRGDYLNEKVVPGFGVNVGLGF